MHEPKTRLDITLTEPVLFLRSADPSGRLNPDANDQPTLVRGILTLHVVKPIGISSIEVDLTGLMAVNIPDGVPPHQTDVTEKYKIYSSTVTLFRADQASHGKRPASVGPGLLLATNDNDYTCQAPRGRRRSAVITGVNPDLGPTPPYTPVALSQTPIQLRVGENPAQTLEELRRALRENLSGQSHREAFSEQRRTPSPLPVFSPPNSTTRTDISIPSNEPLHRDNDYMAFPSPPYSDDTSFHSTAEELPHIPPRRGSSPCGHSRSYSPEHTRGSHAHAHNGNTHEFSSAPTGRSRLRLSLSTVLDAVMEVASRTPSRSRGTTGLEERERGRTRARIIAEEQRREPTPSEGVASSSQLAADAFHPSGHTEHREHHLLGLGRVLGLQRDHEKEKDMQLRLKEHRDSGREFKPGTYSYPISFLLPPNLPPTFSVPRGCLTYTIRGVAHRPGTFASKLSRRIPLLVVAAPTAGAGEGSGPGDLGPLVFEKQWENMLAYSFTLSSRLFLLGSQRNLEVTTSDGSRANIDTLVGAEADVRTEAAHGRAILDLTILPLEKIKIWRLSVVVEQHIRYIDQQRKLVTEEGDKCRVKLLEVHDMCPPDEVGLVLDELDPTHKYKQRFIMMHDNVGIPLLPTPISPHRSPLLQYLPPSADLSILAGPGPYTLSAVIALPDCSNNGLNFTVKHKNSRLRVEHFLKLIIRVERMDVEDSNNHEQGNKKRFFDITAQAPITILSCRCLPEYQMLPRYSPTTDDGFPDRAVCSCQPGVTEPIEHAQGCEFGNHIRYTMSSSAGSSFEGEDGVGSSQHRTDELHSTRERSPSPSRPSQSSHPSPLTVPQHLHPLSLAIHSHVQHHRVHSQPRSVSINDRTPSGVTPVSSPHSSRPPSPAARYERLVSGLESEAGEAPPSYESIAPLL